MNPKYPRTFHLPWSPGGTNDDRRMASVSGLLGEPVILTEKMDGSNVCLEAKKVVARSHAGPPKHPSFDALKALHAGVKHVIPVGVQVFAEWCFAQHSIAYEALPGYLLVFGVRCNGEWASWDEVQIWAQELNASTVPLLTSQVFGTAGELQAAVMGLASEPSACGGDREGVVARVARAFHDQEFASVVAKHVRADHVQTDEHWTQQAIVRNKIAL